MAALAPAATALAMSLPASDAAVAEDLCAVTHRVDDGCDERQRGRRPVELATSVVRQRDGVDACIGGEDRIGDGLHALDDDGPAPHGPQPIEVVPRKAGVELGVDVVREADR